MSAESEAEETKRLGKPGPQTANVWGNTSWYALFARNFAAALAAAERALSIAPALFWIETNRAHAMMFLDRIDDARAIYLGNRGREIAGQGPWEKVIVADFAEFRRMKMNHPLMVEIERAFAAPEP